MKNILLLFGSILLLQSCARPTSFQSVAELDTVSKENIPSEVSLPQLKIESHSCTADSECSFEIQSSTPLEADLITNWKTIDNAFEKKQDFYAIPNKHYVPSQGQLLIRRGEMGTKIKVRSISWNTSLRETSKRNIPISISGCSVAGVKVSCAKLITQ